MCLVSDFGLDLWINLILSNDLADQDILNLGISCKFLSQLLKNEKIRKFVEDRKIRTGCYHNERPLDTHLAVAWSPDNRRLASGNIDGKIFVWLTKTKTIERILKKNDFSTNYCLDFHPQSTELLAAGYGGGSLWLWDLEKGDIKWKFQAQTSDDVNCLAFDPTGRFLASGSSGTIVFILDVESGSCKQKITISDNSWMYCIAFTPDGKFVAASNTDSELFLWNAETFELVHKVLKLSTEPYYRVPFRFLNDNKTLILNDYSKNCVRFFDYLTGEEDTEKQFRTKNSTSFNLDLHPDQKRVAVSGQYGVEIWDLHSKTLLAEKCSKITVLDLAFSPNGNALAVALDRGNTEVFDLKK